ncbi:MAG: type II toxin-antitoxin system RelE/ParE family toxin [Acidobacteria bacterium]|nr:type II toxin-antitoxin system RelE/ParE family toxin [Acidobacteriota bacterium]
MRRIRLSREARADLDEIWLYVARASGLATADSVIDAITDRFLLIARMPLAGRRRDELRPGVRSFPVGEHVIYYSRRESAIAILRVLHGARDTTKQFDPS